jgi:predicted alpha/beta-hydrolase family hydrolase
MEPRAITINLPEGRSVSGLYLAPARSRACYVLGHGAGVNMAHASMRTIAEGLAERGVASLRYNFLYSEAGGNRTDPPPLCHAVVRAAVAEAARLAPGVPLLAGGRSFGGRMTSQAQALEPLPGVHGLVFFAFPLHPAKKPATDRADHLNDVRVPMLFLQGDRDELAEMALLERVVAAQEDRATLKVLAHADHSFHVLARSGRKDADVRDEALNSFDAWLTELLEASG